MEDNEELLMKQHGDEFRQITRFFNITYYICVIPEALGIIGKLAMLLSIIVTLGMSVMSYTFLDFFRLVIGIAGVFICGFSNAKEEKASKIAPVFYIFRIVFGIIYGESILSCNIYAVSAVMQYLCLRKYERINFLKQQNGYPEFNPIFFNDKINRRLVSDNEVRSNMSIIKENKDKSAMEELSLPEMPYTESYTDDNNINKRLPPL